MHAQTSELPTAGAPASPSLGSDRWRFFRGGWFYVWLVIASLAIAGVSMLYPSTPSYDPWSWLLWGREIVHGHLSLQATGSSWKPMPVIFTTVFALIDSAAAPNLWLLVARAGAVLTVLMSFDLTARIVWWLMDSPALARSRTRSAVVSNAALLAPAALAGGIVALGVALTHGFPGDSLLGYSEGVAVGATLIGFERALDGHHRQAFALGLVAALDRPEAWIVWGPYGLWMMWKDPGSRKLVIGLAVLVLALWFVPQKLGHGSAVGTALTSRSAFSAANTSFPFWNELKSVEWILVLTRVKIIGIITIIVSCAIVGRRWRATHTLRPTRPRDRAVLLIAILGLFGFAWWIMIALETQAGFAGNPRYAVFGSVPEYMCGGIGYSWAALALTHRGRELLSARGRSVSANLGLLLTTALMGIVFLIAPGWVGGSLLPISSIRYEMRYQSRIREELVYLIDSHGGPQAILRCGSINTENHQVPMVAWYLNVPTIRIGGNPSGVNPGSTGPNVLIQVAASPGSPLVPLDSMIGQWIANGANYQITQTDPVNFYENCRK